MSFGFNLFADANAQKPSFWRVKNSKSFKRTLTKKLWGKPHEHCSSLTFQRASSLQGYNGYS